MQSIIDKEVSIMCCNNRLILSRKICQRPWLYDKPWAGISFLPQLHCMRTSNVLVSLIDPWLNKYRKLTIFNKPGVLAITYGSLKE